MSTDCWSSLSGVLSSASELRGTENNQLQFLVTNPGYDNSSDQTADLEIWVF